MVISAGSSFLLLSALSLLLEKGCAEGNVLCNGYPISVEGSPCCTTSCADGCLQGGVHRSTKCEDIVDWKKEMGADIRSSPTLNSGSSVVYIGVMNEAHVNSQTGGIYALDSAFSSWYDGRGGRVLASYSMPASISCAGTTTLTKNDSMAFIGCDDGLHAFSLGAADSSFFNEESQGSHFTSEWVFANANSPIESKPILNADESVIYVTSVNDGYVHALNVATDLTNGTDRVRWSFSFLDLEAALAFPENNPGMKFTVGSHFIHSSPVLSPAGDKIYFVGFNSFLLCLNADNGSVVWISSKHTDLGTLGTFSSPVLSEPGDLVYLGTDKGFGAYNAFTGEVVWKDTFAKSFQTYRIMTAAVYTNVDSTDSVVFFGRDDWYLYAYAGRTGERVGRFKADGPVKIPILHPSEQILFVGGTDRQFRSVRFNASLKLDTSDTKAPFGLGIFPGASELDVQYEWTILAGGELLTTPTISNDGHLIYFGSLDQALYAAHSGFDTTTTTQTTTTLTTTSNTITTLTTSTATSTTATLTFTSTTATSTTFTATTTTATTTTATTATTTTTATTSTLTDTSTSTTTVTSSTSTTSWTSTTTTTLVQCPDDEFRTTANNCSACAHINCRTHYFRTGVCADDINNFACNLCENIACDNNEYRSGNCTGTTNKFKCKAHEICKSGEYLLGAGIDARGECLPCPAGSFRPNDGHRNTSCARWQTCSSNFWSISGSSTKDTLCFSHQHCGNADGVYESSAATMSTARICSQLTDCKPGEYVAAAATPTSDRDCKSCLKHTFSNSKNAEKCTIMSSCSAGEKASAAKQLVYDIDCVSCGPNTFQNDGSHRITECNEQPSCGLGQYITAYSATTEQQCAACIAGTYQNKTGHRAATCATQTKCGIGQRITADSTRKPRFCLECERGTYQDLEEHQEETCNRQPQCTTGQFISKDLSFMISKATCIGCPANTYQDAPNHQEMECSEQQRCSFGEKISETSLYDATTKKKNCLKCSVDQYLDQLQHRATKCIEQPNCTSGERYLLNVENILGEGRCEPCLSKQYQLKKTHRDATCRPWTVCDADNNQFIAKNGTLHQNQVCGSNEECAADQYESQTPTNTLPRLCQSLSDCPPGSFIEVAATTTSDRVCTSCDGDTSWQNATNQLACMQTSTCGPGEKVDPGNRGSREKNLECQSCKLGNFQRSLEHRNVECQMQPDCTYGQRIRNFTSLVAEATCDTCPLGQFQSNGKHQNTKCQNYTKTHCKENEQMIQKGSNIKDQACLPCQAGMIQIMEWHDNELCTAASTPTTTATTTPTTTPTSTVTSELGAKIVGAKDRNAETVPTTTPAATTTTGGGIDASEIDLTASLSLYWQWLVIGGGALVMLLIIVGLLMKKSNRAQKRAKGAAALSQGNIAVNPALDPAVAAIVAGLMPAETPLAAVVGRASVKKGRASAETNPVYRTGINGEDSSDDDGYLDVTDSLEISNASSKTPAQEEGLYAMAAGGRKFEVVPEALYDQVLGSKYGSNGSEYTAAVLDAMVGEEEYGGAQLFEPAAYDNPNKAIPSLGSPLYALAANGNEAPAAGPLYAAASSGGVATAVRAKRSVQRLDTIGVMECGGHSEMLNQHLMIMEPVLEPAYQMAGGSQSITLDGPTYAMAHASHRPARQKSFHEQTQDHLGHSLYDSVSGAPGISNNEENALYNMAASSSRINAHGVIEPAVYEDLHDHQIPSRQRSIHEHANDHLGESTYQEVAFAEPSYAFAAGITGATSQEPMYAMSSGGKVTVAAEPTYATASQSSSTAAHEPMYALAGSLKLGGATDSEYDLDTGYVPANTAVRSNSNRRASTIAADGAIIYQDKINEEDELTI